MHCGRLYILACIQSKLAKTNYLVVKKFNGLLHKLSTNENHKLIYGSFQNNLLNKTISMFDVFSVFGWGGSKEFFKSIGERIAVIKAAFSSNSFNCVI
jgi:hypothetical protein